MIGAEGKVAPEILVLAQHLAHFLRTVEARMRPQDSRLRPLLEQAVYRVHIRVRMEEKLVLPRQLHHAPRHRQVSVSPVQVEFADPRITVFPQPLLKIGDHALIAEPGADFAARTVGAQLGYHQVGCQRGETLLAVVAGA